MIRYAETLGDGLDFVRVDFYDAGKVHFGELTLYPNAGLEFSDPTWNRYFGNLWDTPRRRPGPGRQERRRRNTGRPCLPIDSA
jgi:hypothetical protein